jgi:uncharacterized protein with PQ loop repeat
MKAEQLSLIPYTATSISVLSRIIFMFLLYRNKSINSLSLLICILSTSSSSMWLYYSVVNEDTPMITRTSLEILLLSISSIYIIRNKIKNSLQQEQVIPK